MTEEEFMQKSADGLKRLTEMDATMDIIRAQLAQPEPQETIAKWIKANTEHRQWYICPKCSYQAPRFRDEWVGLTKKEMDYIEGITLDRQDAIRMAAVALQEKNSG